MDLTVKDELDIELAVLIGRLVNDGEIGLVIARVCLDRMRWWWMNDREGYGGDLKGTVV